jgi:hypothetical protein
MAVPSVNASGNNADLYKLLQQSKTAAPGGKPATSQAVDSDGDHDGSKSGEVEGATGLNKLA